MARMLFLIHTGPENPTKTALALLVAKTALGAGNEVDVFFAGDAVQFLRDETLDAAHGVGLGSVREHYDALASGGARLFASGLSAVTRGLAPEALSARSITPSRPDDLVALSLEADRVLTF